MFDCIISCCKWECMVFADVAVPLIELLILLKTWPGCLRRQCGEDREKSRGQSAPAPPYGLYHCVAMAWHSTGWDGRLQSLAPYARFCRGLPPALMLFKSFPGAGGGGGGLGWESVAIHSQERRLGLRRMRHRRRARGLEAGGELGF